MQQEVAWRDGDIVISVPVKSGTTWTMNIVHQLRSGGDADFVDVYAEVRWLEFVPSPDARREELLAAFEDLPRERRRAFKSHSSPPDLPYVAPGTGPDVRYVVVMRNPDEAVASMRPFIAGHSDAWFDLWQIPKDDIVGPDLATFVEMMAAPMLGAIFGFVEAWWELRDNENVLFVHFNDLKLEQEATVRSIADFLGFDVADDAWPVILEYTSFPWMKAHEDKFEGADHVRGAAPRSRRHDPEGPDRRQRRGRRDAGDVGDDPRRWDARSSPTRARSSGATAAARSPRSPRRRRAPPGR